MDKNSYYNNLLDWYAPLLTEKQMEIAEMALRLDYSLAEIAELLSTSRNAVHDTLKRVEKHLEHYEEKLQLYKKFKQRESYYGQLRALNNDQVNEVIDALYETE